MRIRTYFLCCMAAITAVAVTATASSLVSATGDYDRALRLRDEVTVFGRLLLIPEKIVDERVVVSDIILGHVDYGDSQRAKVASTRSESDQALAAALDAASRQPGGGKRSDVITATIPAVRDWRATADDLLTRPGDIRDPAAFGAISSSMAAILAKFDAVFDNGDHAAMQTDAIVSELVALAQMGWTLRSSSSRRAVPLLTALATAKPLSAQALEGLAAADVAVDKDWAAIDGFARQIDSEDMRQKIAASKNGYKAFEETYRATVRAGRAGNAYPISATEFGAAFVHSFKWFLQVRDDALARAHSVSEARVDAARSQLLFSGMELLASVAIALGTTVLLTRRVVSPIGRLTNVVEQIAVKNFGVTVPDGTRRDEIGRMSHAIEELRGN